MAGAKDLILRPIDSRTANAGILRWHYSGTVVRNSQLHMGVFWQGVLEGVLQWGPSLDKRRIMGLVRGTGWHQVLELNRMAFSDRLPRNSESRALAVACRLLRQAAPQVKWVLTFADATQCGDGTIYRAAGFLLTAIKRNDQIWRMPADGSLPTRKGNRGRIVHELSIRLRPSNCAVTGGAASMAAYQAAGAERLAGFQLRYLRFLDPAWRERLTVPVLPYAAIVERGASMYRGRSADSGTAVPTAGGGARPTRPLQAPR